MSDSDDENKLRYIDVYPKLPSNAPLGHPHIVDFESLYEDFPREEMSIADLVVSVLFNYKAAALDAFLDLERPEVHYVHHPGDDVGLDFCIQRKGRVVKVGYLNEREQGGWDEIFKYRLDSDATGHWTALSMQMFDGSIEEDPAIFELRVPEFAVNVACWGVWKQDPPGVEIEWCSGLLQGRHI